MWLKTILCKLGIHFWKPWELWKPWKWSKYEVVHHWQMQECKLCKLRRYKEIK